MDLKDCHDQILELVIDILSRKAGLMAHPTFVIFQQPPLLYIPSGGSLLRSAGHYTLLSISSLVPV
jgi:hypothetical protein